MEFDDDLFMFSTLIKKHLLRFLMMTPHLVVSNLFSLEIKALAGVVLLVVGDAPPPLHLDKFHAK